MQAVLFDCDGVILESADVKTKAFAKLFKQFGNDIVSKVVDHHIKNGGISRYKKIRYYYYEFLKKDLTDDELNKIADIFSGMVLDKIIVSPFVDGVIDYLESDYKKIDMYVISGIPQSELEIIVEKKKIGKYFKGLYGTDEFVTKTDIINKVILENNYDKKQIVYIGDSLSDYHNAKNANISFIGRVAQSQFPKGTKLMSNFVGVKI